MDPYVIQQALVLIGRSEGEIITHDPQCSRRHAQICLEHDGSVWLEDLGSTNGTLLKGKVIKEKSRLENNSEFTCGQTRFQLMIHPIARNRKST
ncbi:MAG: FHA domain-containing protein [Holophagaceae bacterium]